MSQANPRWRRWFSPRFSLAAALIGLTLSAIGLWYWYRVPYEVVHESVDYLFSDPLTSAGHDEVQGVDYLRAIRGARQVASVRRSLGQQTIRHGLLTTYDAQGKKRVEESFREDIRHGSFRRWYADGRAQVEGAYERGRPHGEWQWYSWVYNTSSTEVFPPTRYKCTARWHQGRPHGTWQWGADPIGPEDLQLEFEHGRLVGGQIEQLDPSLEALLREQVLDHNSRWMCLLSPGHFGYESTPLKDACQFLANATGVRLRLDARRLKENGTNIDVLITFRSTCKPLAAHVTQLSGLQGLAIDYRYGTLWITTPQAAANRVDPTGIANVQPPPGSPLARAWDLPTSLHLDAAPLNDSLALLEREFQIRFDLSRLRPEEQTTPVTLWARESRDLPLRDALGILLDGSNLRCALRGETLVIEPQK